MELKDVMTIVQQVSQQVLAYKDQGYDNISVKQVNDPNDAEKLQEQILIDMTKNGVPVEVRIFNKKEDGGQKIKIKEGKIKKNG